MKKETVIALLLLTALGGFGLGYAFRPSQNISLPGITPPEAIPISVASDTSSESLNREKDLLLQAIEELNLTAEELEDAQNYIHKLERNTHRYNWLMDYWTEKGFGASYELGFGAELELSLTPSDELQDYFGWDEEHMSAIVAAGQSATDAILSWETDHMTCLEEADDKLVYQVEGIPDEIRQRYIEQMEAILDPDDMELLRNKLEKNFGGLSDTRTITLSIGPPPMWKIDDGHEHENDWMTVSVTSKIDPSDPVNYRAGNYAVSSEYTPGETISDRWNHIFQMESNRPAVP